MDVGDNVGTCQREQIIASMQVFWMGCKPLASEIGFCQSVLLYLRAHGAIEHKDALRQCLL